MQLHCAVPWGFKRLLLLHAPSSIKAMVAADGLFKEEHSSRAHSSNQGKWQKKQSGSST
jgi:hypothetical protein